jgi:uncharacterized protein (TIGR03435 family)
MRIVNSSLKFCVEMAWNVKDFQVTGATGWMDNDHYDIDAVAAAPFKAGEYRGMFQALLADRFGLVVHRETKDRPGYALVIAKNGSKLPPPAEEPDVMFGRTPSGDVSLKARKATLAQLAGVLSSMLGVVVVNQTGIEGRYDVSLQYTPDPTSQPALGKPGVTPPPPPADAVPGPSIFDALQEKLGLKLEARKVPVEMVVIDRANRPSEN